MTSSQLIKLAKKATFWATCSCCSPASWKAGRAAGHDVTKSQTWLSNWTTRGTNPRLLGVSTAADLLGEETQFSSQQSCRWKRPPSPLTWWVSGAPFNYMLHLSLQTRAPKERPPRPQTEPPWTGGSWEIWSNPVTMRVFRGSFVTLFAITSRPDQAPTPPLAGSSPADPLKSFGPSRWPLVHHLVVDPGTAPLYWDVWINAPVTVLPGGPPLIMEKYNPWADFSKQLPCSFQARLRSC